MFKKVTHNVTYLDDLEFDSFYFVCSWKVAVCREKYHQMSHNLKPLEVFVLVCV